MAQLNINLTPAFERALTRLMRIRRIKTKSEAVRVAVEEALAASSRRSAAADFAAWIGLGTTAAQNPAPRFPDHASLWS
jgi:hypothetical protein